MLWRLSTLRNSDREKAFFQIWAKISFFIAFTFPPTLGDVFVGFKAVYCMAAVCVWVSSLHKDRLALLCDGQGSTVDISQPIIADVQLWLSVIQQCTWLWLSIEVEEVIVLSLTLCVCVWPQTHKDFSTSLRGIQSHWLEDLREHARSKRAQTAGDRPHQTHKHTAASLTSASLVTWPGLAQTGLCGGCVCVCLEDAGAGGGGGGGAGCG